MNYEKLRFSFGVTQNDVKSILEMLDADRWFGCCGIDSIKYAGTIDNEDANKVFGHNGFWISDDSGHIAFATNGDPIWTDWDEEAAKAIGLNWGSFDVSAREYKVK